MREAGAGEQPLKGQPWLEAPASRRVLDALQADGKPARFVGGCVRDGLLGCLAAGADLDLATPEHPARVMQLLEAAGVRAIPTGLAHGTVSAVIGGQHFEITTLRRDVACDGRHAEVEFTDDFAEDAARRDFTINAMSCDGEGRLYDFFGGCQDLAAGYIRFVGPANRRIAEDYLRILRFFRFFARYGRPPADAAAMTACAEAAANIRRLSGERIQAEMLKLLAARDPVPSLALMLEAGVVPEVLGGEIALGRLRAMIEVAPEADPLLRLGALLRPPPAAPEAASWVAERWRLSRHDAERLQAFVGAPLVALDASTQEHRRTLYGMGRERYVDLARLAAAEQGDGAREALAAARAIAAHWQPPALPVTGHDILAQGVPPGRRVGMILDALERWWVEQDFRPGRAACLARAREIAQATAADMSADGGVR